MIPLNFTVHDQSYKLQIHKFTTTTNHTPINSITKHEQGMFGIAHFIEKAVLFYQTTSAYVWQRAFRTI